MNFLLITELTIRVKIILNKMLQSPCRLTRTEDHSIKEGKIVSGINPYCFGQLKLQCFFTKVINFLASDPKG